MEGAQDKTSEMMQKKKIKTKVICSKGLFFVLLKCHFFTDHMLNIFCSNIDSFSSNFPCRLRVLTNLASTVNPDLTAPA